MLINNSRRENKNLTHHRNLKSVITSTQNDECQRNFSDFIGYVI